MKNTLKIIAVIIAIFLIQSCKEKDVPTIPTVTTEAVTNIEMNQAISGGTVTDDGNAEVVDRGVCWSTASLPSIADNKSHDGLGLGFFRSIITELTHHTRYYVRAYATNSVGTAYGNELVFETSASLPDVTTNSITKITPFSATCGGNVTYDGGASVTARGVCWNISQNPTIENNKTTDGSGIGTFSSNIIELNANTSYYVRAYATNNVGTVYGNQINFTTTADGQLGTVTDIDGNSYKTVVIGSQIWMAENLKTSRFNDGESIPLVSNEGEFWTRTTPAYCWYENNESSYGRIYGSLYNFHAVNTTTNGNRNICPLDWHVPTKVEWDKMVNYLIENGYNWDGSTTQNKIAKSLGSATYWAFYSWPPCIGSTDYPGKRNATGFTALPGGTRQIYFLGIGYIGAWWSSSPIWAATLNNTDDDLKFWEVRDKECGLSVRCVKD